MIGRNGGKGRSPRSSKSDTVVSGEGPRPVHLVEDRHLGAQR
jgi:hypothetical protein